jgi:hypothetical protein
MAFGAAPFSRARQLRHPNTKRLIAPLLPALGGGAAQDFDIVRWVGGKKPEPTARDSLAGGRKPVHEYVELCVLPLVVRDQMLHRLAERHHR